MDFEARNIMVTAVDFSDHPLKQAHKGIAQSDSVEDVIQKIEQAIEELVADKKPNGKSRLKTTHSRYEQQTQSFDLNI
ncbi:MAG: hypothetical protein ACREE6_01730 [Limisphaerales bacterium]